MPVIKRNTTSDYKALASARVKAGDAYDVKRFLGQLGQTKRKYAARGAATIASREARHIADLLYSYWVGMLKQNPKLREIDTARSATQSLGIGRHFSDVPAQIVAGWLNQVQEDVKTALAQAYATGGVRSARMKDTYNASAVLDELAAIDEVIDKLIPRLVAIKKQAFAAGVGGVVQSMNKAQTSLYDAGSEITAARVSIRQHLTKRE